MSEKKSPKESREIMTNLIIATYREMLPKDKVSDSQLREEIEIILGKDESKKSNN